MPLPLAVAPAIAAAAPFIATVGVRAAGGVAAYLRTAPIFAYFFGLIPSVYFHEWITDKELKGGADPKELAGKWWQQHNKGYLQYRRHTLEQEGKIVDDASVDNMIEFARAFAEERRVMPGYQGIPNSASAAGITPNEHYEKLIDIEAVAEIVIKDEKVRQDAAVKAMEEWVRQRRGEQGSKERQERGPAPKPVGELVAPGAMNEPPAPSHSGAARTLTPLE
jgi:hypothetical protein